MRFSLTTYLTLSFSGLVSGSGSTKQLLEVPIGELSRASEDFVYQIRNSDISDFSRYHRDYFTLFVVTSTDEKHGCHTCVYWKSILRKVAAAWFYDYLESDYMFIAEADLIDPSNIELLSVMQISTVPQIWLIPPTHLAIGYRTEDQNPDKDETNWQANDLVKEPHSLYVLPVVPPEQQVLKFADWLAGSVQKPIFLREQYGFSKLITTFTVTFATIMLLKKKGPSFITGFVTKSKVYQVFYFLFLYLTLAGAIFSFITPVPFIARNEQNEVIYISGGNAYQFGIEIFIVALSYFVLGALLLALCYMGQYMVTKNSAISSEATRGTLVLALGGALYLTSSVLSSICLRKDHEYPYVYSKLF
ncbi:hypothetical protein METBISCDRAFT_21928 [Metschnikowia bicuspidata]|uniref:Uncharacterized protein n=1 Tax=Metschnikowia bicuspidata TaxID=27322 RepID=A0A4P9ZI69_9ASCO|nr:hypothetical protein METBISCDRAFT_21928 [Metschnikowia bicuspidata]